MRRIGYTDTSQPRFSNGRAREASSYPNMRERAEAEGYIGGMNEAAKLAGVSLSTLKRYVRAGVIYPQTESTDRALGYRYWFSREDLERVAETYEHNLTWLRIGLQEHVLRKRKRSQGFTGY